jgi:predicted O-linked N-acetylglucosamine transferase (SPINDLY family)
MAENKILEKFSKNKVDIKRITFEKTKKERIDHLNMYKEIDISLDTFPYPGVTTSFESIWMGVPVLTKKGTNFVSRCGESINLNLGFKNLIAESEEDYISKAVSLNLDRENLSKMRLSMRQLAMKSPLFDTHSFGEDFSNLIKNVWKKYLNKKI